MPDREKVIKELELFIKEFHPACTSDGIELDMFREVLALLKEQEDLGTELTNAVELIHKKNKQIEKLLKLLKDEKAVKPNRLPNKKVASYKNVVYQYSCGNCSTLLRNLWKACPLCGKQVKWE